MQNRMRFFGGDGANRRKDKLDAWFSKQNFSEEEIMDLLEQNLRQRKNIKLVKDCIKDAGLGISGLVSNDKLELYFDIYKNKKSVCYVSKGWKDPGFRIGELIDIDKDIAGFKEKFYKIFYNCSSNLMSVSVSEPSDKFVSLSLEIGIYRDGFNAKVLRDAIETLEKTLKAISKILYPETH
ncbi:MAG: hypothetical protein WC695_08165 [Candidatus Omnitrophota bacterium]